MRSFMLSEVLLIVLITTLAQKLAQSTVSEKSDSSIAFIIADNTHSIYIANGERVVKLLTSEYPIYSVGYSSSTKIIVWCDSNGINYVKLKNPLEPSILLHDKCNAIDVNNNEIYYYSQSKEQIIKINNFNRSKQFIHPIIYRSNVLSLKYDPINNLLFWIEQHSTSDTNQLTQLNLSSNTYEQTPKTYSIDEFDGNDCGFPRLFDINYFDQKIYVITQNSYFLQINYNGETRVNVFDGSSETYGRTLSSISYYNQYIYFHDSVHKRITAQCVSQPTAQYNIPNISEFNNHVVSILGIQNYNDIFADIKSTPLANRHNSMMTTSGHKISTQNISETDGSKRFNFVNTVIVALFAIIIIIAILLYILRWNGKNTYRKCETGDENETVNFIIIVSQSHSTYTF